jgi:hypothetical protein
MMVMKNSERPSRLLRINTTSLQLDKRLEPARAVFHQIGLTPGQNRRQLGIQRQSMAEHGVMLAPRRQGIIRRFLTYPNHALT